MMRTYFGIISTLFLFSIVHLDAQNSCMEFTGLNGIYGPSGPNDSPAWYETFHTEGNINLSAQGFQDEAGNLNGSAYIAVAANQFSGAFTLANGVFAKTAPSSTLIFDIPISDTVVFNYMDWNSILNFAVNNEPIAVVSAFSELPSAIAPGVTMIIDSLPVGGGSQGTITLIGYIHKVIVGGDNMGIDNFCQFTSTSASCLIEEVSTTTQPCSNGQFMTTIDLVYADTGSLGFSVSANGTNLGTFSYADLPVSVGPLTGDGSTDWTITVTDVENSYCTAYGNLGVISCSTCAISEIVAEPLACANDSSYTAYIEFIVENNSSTDFDVSVDGQYIGTYSSLSLPFIIDFPSTASGSQLVTICETGSNCCGEQVISALDCTPAPACEIGNLLIDPLACDDFGKYNAILDFEYNNNSTSFIVTANGINYGSFEYANLPVTIGAFIGNGSVYQISVTDNGPGGSCSSGGVVGPVNCPVSCSISAIETEALQCTSDSTYSLYLDFNHGGGSDQFKVSTSSGALVGTYAYAQLPLTISNFPSYGATPETVSVSDAENPDCVATKSFTPLFCSLPCEITSMSATASVCDSNNMFTVEIDMTYTEPGSSFELTGIGTSYGTFAYTDLPVTIGPLAGDGITDYDFFAQDVDNPNCLNETTVGVINCGSTPCEIGQLIIEPLECISDSFYTAVIDFEVANPAGTTFTVSDISGNNIGSYGYASLPVTVTLQSFGNPTETLMVCDSNSPNCCSNFTFDALDCNVPDCDLSNLVIETIECTSPNTISLTIDLDNVNTSGSFDVFSSTGYVGSYDYAALPLTILEYPTIGDAVETMIICDAMNQNCCTEMNFESLDCSGQFCNLDSMTLEILPCDSTGNVSVIVDFDYSGTSDSFMLVGNGNTYGTFSYENLPVTIGSFAGDEVSIYELEAIDIENADCTTFTTFGPVDCIFICELSNLFANPLVCTSDSTYTLQLNFDAEDVSINGFDVIAQGTFIGTYSYADLPLDIEDFPTLDSDVIQLSVCDTDNPNCCASILYEAPDCSGGCNIYEVVVEPFGCDEGEFSVSLNLDYVNPGSLGFQVFGNGQNYGNFSYNDLPITIEGFNGDGTTEYEFIVIDLLNTSCVNFTELSPFDCTVNCEINNITATSVCEDSIFMIELDFDYNNASANGFMVNGNGTIYGIYDYSNLPIMLGPFEQGDSTSFEFVVTDMVNDNCNNFHVMGQVDCTISNTETLLVPANSIRYNFEGEEIQIALEEALTADATIEIYNATGMKIFTEDFKAGTNERIISVAPYTSGWYIVRLINRDGQIAHPFVKAK